ncbi:helix-turn-helix domain-containing protein [Duganella sp. FT80W]|uniref:Helix-turn-helix domain-containing protein n=1 Tax=Duganella guangzhouensis TaxID=2666084 RepID=A0A6I2LAC2_9BURK|nr:helix-turn-helix transcriptional regulator [Duganella guangzhouensis]MRW93219.1 helix-turn-helix domain-containing protein [Duganella guangzhouensis]
MAIPIVTHTSVDWQRAHPSAARPLVISGRDLRATAMLPPHRHDWGQLTYAVQGVMRVDANHSSWIVPPQRAIWIPPGVVHAVTVLENTHLRPMCVYAGRAPFAGDDCKVLELSPLLRELLAALEAHDRAEQSPREHLLMEMILDEVPRCAVRAVRVPLPADKRLQALCDALIAEPGAEMTLADWAGQVGASERTLSRLFERELGMGFGQWRQQVRLAHAAPLIAAGMPLSQVAAELGYTSQSAFSAMFRKTFGCSPSAFFR